MSAVIAVPLGLALLRKLTAPRAAPDAKRTGFQERSIYRIVLTGGPCAGKTTVLAKIHADLKERGCEVIVSPEVATILIRAGVDVAHADIGTLFKFQTAILNVQHTLEESLDLIAASVRRQTGKPVVIVCDRGMMDGRCYVSDEQWGQITSEQRAENRHAFNNFTKCGMRDLRYDGVVHLVTAADGAESCYLNDAVRFETPAVARELDRRLRESYLGHPQMKIVDNSTDFTTKIERVLCFIRTILGVGITSSLALKRYAVSDKSSTAIPIPHSHCRAGVYLCPNGTPDNFTVVTEREVVEETYAERPETSLPDKRFTAVTYFTADGREHRKMQKISFQEFQANKEASKHQYHFEVYSFIHANKYFEWWRSAKGSFLSVDCEILNGKVSEVELPTFLQVGKEITCTPHAFFRP